MGHAGGKWECCIYKQDSKEALTLVTFELELERDMILCLAQPGR